MEATVSAEELLTIINDRPTMSPHVGVIEEYLTKQEFDEWKEFEKDYPDEDEAYADDSDIARIKAYHGPLLRAGHMRLMKAQEHARKTGIGKKASEAEQAMEVILESYIESVEELGGNIGSMILIDGYTVGAPDYIADHLADPIYIPRSWATGALGKPAPKPTRREKLIEFLEIVIENRNLTPTAPTGGKPTRSILDIVNDLKKG